MNCVATTTITTQECQQRAGEAAEEEPGAEDLSIVVRTMQQPQQEHEQKELQQAGVELGGVQRDSQRSSGQRQRDR